MPENISDKTIFSLLEVTRSIENTIAKRYSQAYWIKAEMNKLNLYKHSGHCYPELIEKRDGKVIAQIKALLWKADYNRINQTFIDSINEPLKNGIKILFLGKISFDGIYGLSITILDIDPNYTLGDLEREKQETIQQLTQENLIHQNKSLPLALLPKRLAIISVETSNGYADFLKVIEHNPWKYSFFYYLFPSLLQGDRAIGSILEQLKRVKKVKSYFDAVLIIRGGGGDIGLSCYNNYELCKAIASFPLPVMTGIGHSTNKTVAEMVAHEDAITPTKLAELLIQKFHDFSVPLQHAQHTIASKVQQLLNNEHIQLQQLVKNISQYTFLLIKQQYKEIEFIEKNIANLSPYNTLKRGYSITYCNGKILSDIKQVKDGEFIETQLAEGKFISKIQALKNKIYAQ